MEGAWRRQGLRGNKPGVEAQFDLTGERLARPVNVDLGEVDYPPFSPPRTPRAGQSARGR